ncbi:MAG: GMP/IMP nucleotidase [Pseudomonadales bacterium]|uniref:HAD superfamily hydrolase n=1 Tax=Oleiphilus messinensis TaxID=141451 RepID=A0A1Y0I1W3_9GAMM|nr:GMP/IMP nucleotidase [Oleiphilus messinensis]ARU54442.1 HAD superfamily hydrolase [Oleiphilus messinensis]MCG8613892.1 GMP/IMP nucleotidase [Pseudomonadales bacterium]
MTEPNLDWHSINTVLLDMDGTLLDLHFDNYFWLTHLPLRYAQAQKLSLPEAHTTINQLITDQEGSLNWYCVDYWSETLGLDIGQLKEEVQHLIAFRPYVEHFLQTLQETHHRVVLVTNAHRKSLNLKLRITQLDRYFDALISSHDYGYPKEAQAFWHRLQEEEPFDPDSTLLIDDSLAVLASAREYGIKNLLSIVQPDSQKPERAISEYEAVNSFSSVKPTRKPNGF